jgi:hypothetical protein
VELRDLEAYGEPGAVVYLADCVELTAVSIKIDLCAMLEG